MDFESKISACQRCPFYGHEYVRPSLVKGSKIFLVGDSPFYNEVKQNEVFVGPAGFMLNACLEEAGIDRNTISISNSIHCAPEKLGVPFPDGTVELCTKLFLQRELEFVQPEIIVPMGNAALKALVPKERGNISKVRGTERQIEFFGKVYRMLPTFHPSFLLRSPSFSEYMINDLRVAAGKSIQTVNGEKADVKYRHVNTKERLGYFWKVAYSSTIYALDTETTSLDYRDAQIISMNFSFAHGEAYIVTFFTGSESEFENKGTMNSDFAKKLWDFLHDASRRVFFHNMKFDLRMLHEWFIRLLGYGVEIGRIRCYETMGLVGLLDENMSQRLKIVVPLHTDLRYSRDEVDDVSGGKIKKMAKKKLVNYACLHGDSKVLLANGTYESISSLVSKKYSGKVYCFDGKIITTARVIGWHKSINKGQDWYKIVTPTTVYGRWGILGGVYTPDHELYTQRGKVRVGDIIPGKDKILTEENCFSRDQLSVFLGSLLGDGGIDEKHEARRGFNFGQSRTRLPYADWKADVFYNFFPKFFDLSKYKEKDSNKNPGGVYKLPYSRYIAFLCRVFERNSVDKHAHKKLILTEKVLKYLEPLGLAVWYQDDGSLGKAHTRLACTKFSEEEINLFKFWMLGRFDIKCKYYHSNGVFLFSGENEVKFHHLILKYMHPSCAYKSLFPEKIIDSYVVFSSNKLFYERILSIERYLPRPSHRGNNTRYCLTVEKCGNFVTLDGIVGNSLDADGTRRIGIKLSKELYDKGLWYGLYVGKDYSDIEVGKSLFKMELFGAPIDRTKMAEIRHLVEGKISGFERQMHKEARQKFNIRSTDQLRNVMYNVMQYPETGVKTKGGKDSTDKNVMALLMDEYPDDEFLMALDYFRKYDSIYKTFVKGLQERLGPDGRLHPDFGFTRTVSGRIVCYNPNLANIPRAKEFEEGVLLTIREMFAARPGWKICMADSSQIEYKVAAIISKDQKMIDDIFLHHQDFHDMIARSAYPQYEKAEGFVKKYAMREEMAQRVASAKIKLKDWRTDAKKFNFASIFGAEEETLARQLGVSVERVNEIIDGVEARYPNFWKFIRESGEKALQIGEVINRFQRHRRLLPTPDERVTAEQGRMFTNFFAQSNAAYVGRGALVRIARRCEKEGLCTYPFNIVYDQVLLEYPEEEEEQCCAIVAEEMLRPCVELDNHVFSIEMGVGDNWHQSEVNAKKLFTVDDLGSIFA